MMLGRYLSVLAIACLAIPFGHQAGATAMIGAVIGASAGTGTCRDIKSVPGDTLQDSLALHVAASCSGGSASLDMHADAATPSIGLRATSSGNGIGSSLAGGQVLFSDQWVLTPPTGTAANTNINIPVSLKLEGSVSPGAVFDSAYGRFLDYRLSVNDKYDPLLHQFLAFGKITATGAFSQVFNGSVDFYNYGTSAFPMTAVVEMELFLPALYEGTVDFFNTASITMDLPPGFSATTSSGLLLDFTQASAPVPEPETGMSMLVGLGLAGFLARRRKPETA